MGAGNLEAWSVTPSDFPATGTLLDKARFAVRYAILAPSSHNTQPCRFVSGGRELLICADRTRSLPNIDPFDRELIISCGAALFNLRVVAVRTSWKISPTVSSSVLSRLQSQRALLWPLPGLQASGSASPGLSLLQTDDNSMIRASVAHLRMQRPGQIPHNHCIAETRAGHASAAPAP
jgi:hypothetical protein